jgi:hypothetical protein
MFFPSPFPSTFECSVAFLSADVCRLFAALLNPSINGCTLENSQQEDCEVVKLLSKSANEGETHTHKQILIEKGKGHKKIGGKWVGLPLCFFFFLSEAPRIQQDKIREDACK